jgi:uncharacterized damage-inducible protein DinB
MCKPASARVPADLATGTLHTAVAFKPCVRSGARWMDMETVTHSSLWTVRTLTHFKAWANETLFTGLRAVPELERITEFDLIRLILDHTLVVDVIFQAHLRGIAHGFDATRSPRLRSLEELAQCSREVDQWYVDYAENVSESSLQNRSEIRFTDGKTLPMSPAEIILHVVTHGTYHRGNLGVLLQKNGIVPQRDGLPEYLARAAAVF